MCSSPAAVADQVAGMITDLVAVSPAAVLGLPSGHTPAPIYERLASSGTDFAAVTVVMLDEYAGLGCTDHRSFCAYLLRHVIRPLHIPDGRLEVLDGAAADLDAECRRYDELVTSTGVDLHLLGIGRDGHIAFDEPGTAHDSRTHVAALADTTRHDNLEPFGSIDAVPTHALTLGIGTILQARRIVLVATGPAKADAIAAAVTGPITDVVPASALQAHDHVTVVVDQAAAARVGLGG